MQHETTISKGQNGWNALTSIALTKPYTLEITTSKAEKGVSTHTCICKHENGFKAQILSRNTSGFIIRDRSVRCTEKTVSQQHNIALKDLPNILERFKVPTNMP